MRTLAAAVLLALLLTGCSAPSQGFCDGFARGIQTALAPIFRVLR